MGTLGYQIDESLGEYSVQSGAVSLENLGRWKEESQLSGVPLGDLLVQKGVVDLESALGKLIPGTRTPPSATPLGSDLVGQIAVERGYLNWDQLNECMKDQQQQNLPLGQILVRKRIVNSKQLLSLLREQERRTSTTMPATVGKYELKEEIGRGGMGLVYRAWDPNLKREIAIKLLRSGRTDDGQSIERFQREASLAARLRHPNIVTAFDVGHVDGNYYIAMDLVKGGSLAQWMREHNPNLRTIIELMTAICDGAAIAHEEGIIHRDIKPGNILMDEKGVPRLTDFGLAKHTEEKGTWVTQDGVAMGTPQYMSPEQIQGTSGVDASTDVWSLGVILYESLTRRAPFRGKSQIEIYEKILREEPRRIRQTHPQIHRDLETIVMKCLEKSAARRYASARELTEDLQLWLNGDPILAHPPSTFYRLRKKAAKRKPVLIAVAVGILAVGGVSALFLLKSNKEKDQLIRRDQDEEVARNHIDMGNRVLKQIFLYKQESEYKPSRLKELVLQAQGEFEKALRLIPGHTQALLGTAQAWAEMDDDKKALEFLDRCVAASPHLTLPYLERIRMRLNRYEVLRHQEGGFFKTESREAREIREKIEGDMSHINAYAKDHLELKYTAAMMAFSEADYAKAAELLEDVVQERPADARALYWQGHALFHIQVFEKAVESLSRAIRLDARYYEAINNRGLCYKRSGQWNKAIADFQFLIRVDPTNSAPRVGLAGTYYERKDYDQALEAYQNAIELDPTYVTAYHGCGLTYQMMGNLNKAREMYTEGLQRDPAHFRMLNKRGEVNFYLGRETDSVKDFELAHKLNPMDAGTAFWLAQVVYKSGDSDRAFQMFGTAIALNENFWQGHFMRGGILYARKEYLRAVEAFREALAINPKHGDSYLFRAVSYEQLGDLKAARQDLKEGRVAGFSTDYYSQMADELEKRLDSK